MNDKKSQTCESGDYGYEECERTAEVRAKDSQGEVIMLCRECASDTAYAVWAHWYQTAGR